METLETQTTPTPVPAEALKVVLPATSSKTSWGALVGVIIIVILLVVAGLYFWGSQLAQG